MKKDLLIFTPAILFGMYWAMVKVALPIVSFLPSYFGTSSATIQQIFSIAFFLSGCFPIFWGPLIDNFELKNFILMNGIIFIGISVILSFSTNIYMFAIFFITACSLTSAFVVVGRAFPFVYLEGKTSVQKALTYGMFGGYFSAWVAPFVSGYLAEHVHWRSVFYIVPVLTIILIFIATKLPKQKQVTEKRTFLKNIITMFQHCKIQSFRNNVLILGLTSFFAQSVLISVPFWLTEAYVLQPYIIGYILFPMLLPGMIGPLLNKFVYNKLSYKTVFYIGFVIFVLGGVSAIILSVIILGMSISYWWWVIPGSLANLAVISIYPVVSFLGYRDIKSGHNAASSVFSLAVYCSGGIGIYFCSLISIHTLYTFGILMLIAITVALLLFLQDYRNFRQEHATTS
ncbi:MFS transporter [Thiotrichales bacterium 19S3-7]|nr:MFS transporter [Thiotrichales bacterium 19S3-7]MCF6801806.1 MFS transporter [Thiotrichales bacterium 19S3-11]